jgi:hypothetical protein
VLLKVSTLRAAYSVLIDRRHFLGPFNEVRQHIDVLPALRQNVGDDRRVKLINVRQPCPD